jgi:hypothetical protein
VNSNILNTLDTLWRIAGMVSNCAQLTLPTLIEDRDEKIEDRVFTALSNIDRFIRQQLQQGYLC